MGPRTREENSSINSRLKINPCSRLTNLFSLIQINLVQPVIHNTWGIDPVYFSLRASRINFSSLFNGTKWTAQYSNTSHVYQHFKANNRNYWRQQQNSTPYCTCEWILQLYKGNASTFSMILQRSDTIFSILFHSPRQHRGDVLELIVQSQVSNSELGGHYVLWECYWGLHHHQAGALSNPYL